MLVRRCFYRPRKGRREEQNAFRNYSALNFFNKNIPVKPRSYLLCAIRFIRVIELAIKVPATRKPLLLILRTRSARRGEFVAPWTRSLLLLRIHYVHGGEFAIKVPASRKPLILLNVSASGHAHASHLFTILENEHSVHGPAMRRASSSPLLAIHAPPKIVQQTDTMKHARHAQPIRIETIASTVIRIHQ